LKSTCILFRFSPEQLTHPLKPVEGQGSKSQWLPDVMGPVDLGADPRQIPEHMRETTREHMRETTREHMRETTRDRHTPPTSHSLHVRQKASTSTVHVVFTLLYVVCAVVSPEGSVYCKNY